MGTMTIKPDGMVKGGAAPNTVEIIDALTCHTGAGELTDDPCVPSLK